MILLRRHSVLVLVLFALALTSCRSGHGTPNVIAVGTDFFSICCDSSTPLPLRVGSFNVNLDEATVMSLAPESIAATITYTGNESTPLRLSVPSGAALQSGRNSIDVFVDACDFSELIAFYTVRVAGVVAATEEPIEAVFESTVVVANTCAVVSGDPAERVLLELMLGRSVPNYAVYLLDTPFGVPTQNSNLAIAPRVPMYGFTETVSVGFGVAEFNQQQLSDAFTGPDPVFPDGQGAEGFSISAAFTQPMGPGLYLVAWQSFAEDIPIASPGLQFQHALVVDADDEPANNYRAQAPFLGDTFDDSDLWFAAEYDPLPGWTVGVTDARGGILQSQASAVRCILRGNLQMFVIPLDEFEAKNSLSGRFTAFAHVGDFGQSGGAFSIDATPPVGETLLRYPLTLSF